MSDSRGSIDINWRFDHTGGQPLTSVNISYYQLAGGSTNQSLAVAVVDRTAAISSLVAGFSYRATVAAANQVGSAQSECPVVELNIGKYSCFPLQLGKPKKNVTAHVQYLKRLKEKAGNDSFFRFLPAKLQDLGKPLYVGKN